MTDSDNYTDEIERDCRIYNCENEATREVWNTRAEKWLPACDKHQPMYSDRERTRSLQADTERDTGDSDAD